MITKPELVDFLSGVPFFQEVSRDSLNNLSDHFQQFTFDRGDQILEKGDPGSSLFVIYTGRVKVHDGEHQYGILKAGASFGEYSLIDKEPRSASVTALEHSVLLELPAQRFLELMQEDPGFSRGILAVMIRRHRELDEVQEGLASSKAAIEVAHAQISSLIEGAMDAIIVFDERMQISLTNPAACQMLQNEDAIGRRLDFFLTEETANFIRGFVERCQEEGSERLQGRLPDPVVLHGSEDMETPVEGTISGYPGQKGLQFTLILHSIQERIANAEAISVLSKQTDYLQEQIRELTNDHGIVSDSPEMRQVVRMVEQVSQTDATVLVLGETGTGKELVSRAIHRASPRADKALIRVNCGAIPANLIESELFGHQKGAFTGAVADRKGRFLLANGGTIFLDEIGELPLDLQPKLLRVIQEGEFEPLGSSETISVDVRIVAATHRDLKKAVTKGTFREDLYYRLNVFPIRIPPLRDRGADILRIAEDMMGALSVKMNRKPLKLSDGDKALLLNYKWPGNVRELQNLLERAMILAQNGRIDWQSLLIPAQETSSNATTTAAPTKVMTQEELRKLEKQNILRALELTGGRVAGSTGAAALLGIPATTLFSKMKSLGITKAFSSYEKS
ncbi:PAS domain S-box-containing protein [Robiginitalea myxolifaciens]|uniref:PAS domain S-box-containing protein n=1 Tax=Robiginitalea myxolifaciens TaxID=400055 RepID=A0A1I6HJL5_9FLAO|nr:sigma 54-interacting transcriptional regulator [Robiginitalea myxolifaciens]SFR54665.1 PAS domain S-box-containing protein [Robiginitalea myxolifaciens]